MNPRLDELRVELLRVVSDLGAPSVDVHLERPREDAHGDVSTNVAMQLAQHLKQSPRTIATQIVERLELPDALVSKVELAGPGFINFWLTGAAVTDLLPTVLAEGDRFGRRSEQAGPRVNVEFVSTNPTGPLHAGHGRGAALGDAISSLLEAVGCQVTREFYVNDAGVQIDRLAASVWARVQEAVGRNATIPEGGYQGEYVTELAQSILAERGAAFADVPESEGVAACREIGVAAMREEQRLDLEAFGVVFDVYSSETDLYTTGSIADTLNVLGERDVVFEKDDALWLRATAFGDTKDRVLRKRDGTYTYLLPDIAYHRGKAARGFTRAIDVWGADHHGYVPRMRAALIALGLPKDFFEAVVVQLVRVMREGQEVRFSKRAGDSVMLRDLFEQTGVDAARYFFLMRKGDSQFVFDIDLATKQSDENPVYYVQYAHTRLAGIFRNAEVDSSALTGEGVDLSVLTDREELDLVQHIGAFPEVVERAAHHLEPHRIIAYLEELARLVNGWYHRFRVIGEPEPVMQARLVVARAAQVALANGLHLLGISAPVRM